MAQGGGSINMRLSLKGAEQVRAELASIGPAGSKMARELDRAMRQPTPAMQALDAGVSRGRQNLEGFANRSGAAGAALSALGGWGLAAAAALSAVALGASLAMNRLREAMTFAADLTDTADRIGTNVEALQEWSYVADEAGVKVESLQANMEKLNGTLGRLKTGIGDAKLRPWAEELGITKADLDNIKSADQLMMVLADRLGQIEDRSKQVAAARAFGVEDSLPILRLGSERIRELSEEARRLGLVLNAETVAALDNADRAVEKATQRIEGQMRFAVAGLADDFADLVTSIAGAMNMLNRFLERYSDAKRQANALMGDGVPEHIIAGNSWQALTGYARHVASGRAVNAAGSIRRGESLPDFGPIDRNALSALADAPPVAPTAPPFEPQGHTARGGGSNNADRDAERLRRERERLFEQLDRELLATRRDATRARWSEDTSADRAQLAKSLLALDRQERDAKLAEIESELQRTGAMDERRELLLQQIRDMNAETDILEDRAIIERQTLEHAEAVRAAEQAHEGIVTEILGLAASTARTSDERRTIELELLEIAQRRQRADLEAAIEAEKEPAARARLIEALNRLPELHRAQTADVQRRNAGPLGQWRDSQFQSGAEASEWLQGEALDALDGVNRGLIEAWRNAENAGDAFKAMGDVAVDALNRVVDGLLEIALQRMLIQPLGDALFGGGSGGGGGLLGGFLGNLVGGMFGARTGGAPAGGDSGGLLPGRLLCGRCFAAGGSVGARNLYPVGERGFEFAELPAGTVVHSHEQSQAILARHERAMRSSTQMGSSPAPTINMPVTVVNRTSEPASARVTQTAAGVEVVLEPMVRGVVGKMGGDGSLSRAHQMTPQPIRR